MTNLIIDLNNMFMRSLFSNAGYAADMKTYSDNEEIGQLVRKLATDITFIIRKLNPNRVIFCKDDSSWRKKINIEENEGYKAQREKNKIMNWDNVFNAFNEFIEILNDKGFITSNIKYAEADDLITLWVDKLTYNQNEHCIIVSADEDIRQLINFYCYDTNKKAFITVYNPFMWGKSKNRKLYIPKYFNEWLDTEDEIDIFNTSTDTDKDEFNKLKKAGDVLFEEVDGNSIALKKLFCGDDGDNIPAFYSWENEKNKTVRITESKSDKIIKELCLEDIDDLNDDRKLTELENILTKICGHIPKIDVEERYKRQAKLVYLNRMLFPESINTTFDETYKDKLKNYKVQVGNLNMNSLLEGTKFINASYTKTTQAKTHSIFKDIDNITKKLF